jgi:mannose/fructose/N-acetylgalactosamine-specific phosphotransferase system component IID
MIVIGGFIPSIMAGVKTPLTYVQHVIVQGKPVTETVALQTTLDKIIPYLLPVLFVAFAYWLLRGLRLSAVWVLIVLAVIAFVCGAFGILA